MADAFRERLLGVLSTLKPSQAAVSAAPVPAPSLVIPRAIAQTPATVLVPSFRPPARRGMPVELVGLIILLTGLGIGFSIATLIQQSRRSSQSE